MENNENVIGNEESVLENEENVLEGAERPEENSEESAPDAAKGSASEQTKKMYTQEEVDAIVGKRLARKEAKIRKEYEGMGELTELLRAGTGKKNVGEINDALRRFYAGKGVAVPTKREMSAGDVRTLAKADAQDIIDAGYDEVVEEVDRLAKIDTKSLSPRDRETFSILARYRHDAEKNRELEKIGVGADVYNSAEFRDFAEQFNEKTPISKVYDLWSKTQPKKEHTLMGSMKNAEISRVKDHYSADDIAKLTESDLADPKVWEAVRRSMTGKS